MTQYGFRVGRSTIDAVLRFRQYTEEITARGGVAVAVSIDISNAFNSVPWQAILSAMERRAFPEYVRAIISDYLHERWVSYVGQDGNVSHRRMVCGVPQGSVLGPLLWNIAYDEVLREELPPGCRLICYADDTLLIAEGRSQEVAVNYAALGTEMLVRAIRRLGLRVAPEKTEVVVFPGRHQDPLPEGIRLAGVYVPIRQHIKYLGLLVDGRWSFRAHFQAVLERGSRVVTSLGRLMPNLRGPGERKRRLYAMVVNSIVLYGAPVWAESLSSRRRDCAAFRRLQRTLASRLICAYRTVSGVVAGMLACIPPYELYAQYLSRVFREVREHPQDDPDLDIEDLRRRAREDMVQQWSAKVRGHALPGIDVRLALGPVLREWVNRPHRGQLTFRTTQVLTGHGCFGEYLRRIGKAQSSRCEHCDAAEDSAHHTLAECPAWEVERRALRDVVGADLSLAVLFRRMAADIDAWKAVVSFSETVMLAKETAEREREIRGY